MPGRIMMGDRQETGKRSSVVRTGAELTQRQVQDQEIARQLVERARAEGVNLVGQDSIFQGLLKQVLEGALEVLYLAIRHREPNRPNPTGRTHNWKAAINVLVGYYGDRIDLDGFRLNTAE